MGRSCRERKIRVYGCLGVAGLEYRVFDWLEVAGGGRTGAFSSDWVVSGEANCRDYRLC